MWSTGQPADRRVWFDRLREIGFTGEQCTRGNSPEPFRQNGFGFYVENLVPELAFLHQRRAIYDADWQAYTSTREAEHLVRKPCFHDPEFWAEARRSLQGLVRPYVANRPLLYNLRDELSLGSFANPMDYCFSPHTLREFRAWLREQYSSLEALNAQWETGFASWDEVVPETTYEAKDRERGALAEGALENYSAWADHRAFMDLTFARTLARMRDIIRELDPDTPAGIEGTQMPSAWGGYDLWRLSQAIDWVEPYDIAGSRELWRSFLPQGTPILSTLFGSDFRRIGRRLWRDLLHGDRGVIVWDDDQSRSIAKTAPGLPLTDRGRGLATVFPELKSMAPLLFRLERVDDRIAIHYSQASIRAHWMFESREDGDNWPRRFSSYEASHSRFARVRDSFQRVIEDLGLQYKFVSYEQIEHGELTDGGYKVLLLPQSVAVSAKEAEEIESFVRAGGVVIADNMTATMDEHCRRLPEGRLDALFGITRKGVGWRGGPGAGRLETGMEGYEPDVETSIEDVVRTSTGAPAIIVNPADSGRAVYLNIGMHDYGKLRLTPPAGRPYLALFRRLLSDAGVTAPVRVLDAANGEPAPGVEVWRYRGDDAEYVAVMRNAEHASESLRKVGYPSNEEMEKPMRVRIVLPGEAQVRDRRTNEDLGTVPHIESGLDAWSPIILELRPPSATPAAASAPRGAAKAPR